MRIRKRFPSFPTIPSSVASSEEVPSQKEEMEVSSCPAPTEGKAREAQEVLTDWEAIKAAAHRLLGCSSYTSNRTIGPHAQEEHSSTNPVSNGETDIDIQSVNGRNKESQLEQENPSQTMVIEQGGGNARKQISYLFSNSQMKGNCSCTTIFNTKWTTASSSSSREGKQNPSTNVTSSLSSEGDARGLFLGTSKDAKAETTMTTGGSHGKKKIDSLMQVGSSRSACPNGSCGLKNKDKGDEGSSRSINKKVKTRSLTSIYRDIRSRMPSSSKVKNYSRMPSSSKFNETEEANGKSTGEEFNE